MSTYTYQKPTNETEGSRVDVLGHLMPARAFFFIVVEEPGADGFLVRRCYASVAERYLVEMKLSTLQNLREVFPEKYGLYPRSFESTASIAEHALGVQRITQYVSTSSLFPAGSPRFEGKQVYIDIAAAKRAGVKLVETSDVLRAIDQYGADYPHIKRKAERIARHISETDKEVLPHGRAVPRQGIFTETSLSRSLGLVKHVRVVQVFAVAFTAYDLAFATGESFHAQSVRPIAKEVVRQTGGWGAAYAGARLGAAAGALVGIEAGPGR